MTGEVIERSIIFGGVEYVVLVDAEDEHFLDERTWQIEESRNTFYVRASHHDSEPGDRPSLHRLIAGAPDGVEVDHWNGNGLDNRKANLRHATRQQNAANRVKGSFKATSRYKGVYRKSATRWVAQITVNNKNRFLGSFPNEVYAARCYDAAAREAFGEFAKLNFPDPSGAQKPFTNSRESLRKRIEKATAMLSATPDHDLGLIVADGLQAGREALAALMAIDVGLLPMDHKWLDPECGTSGCQSLVWKGRLERRERDLLEANNRYLNRARLAEARYAKHEKRGSHYRIIAYGKLQSSAPISEGCELVAYQGEDGSFSFRPVAEFSDGRFSPAVIEVTDEMIEAVGQSFWPVNARSKIDDERDEIAVALRAAFSPESRSLSEQIPLKPGYYWAKWRIAAGDTHEGDYLTPSDEWEIVQVNANAIDWDDDPDLAEALTVSVAGVRETQWRDCFVWGLFIADLAPLNIASATGEASR